MIDNHILSGSKENEIRPEDLFKRANLPLDPSANDVISFSDEPEYEIQPIESDLFLSQVEGDKSMSAVEPILPSGSVADFVGIPAGSLSSSQFEHLPANEEMVKLVLNTAYIERFWTRIETAQRDVSQKINNVTLAGALLQKIQYARNYILAGVEYFGAADSLLSEVEHRIAFGDRVVEASRRVAPFLLLYEVVWGALFGFFIWHINVNESFLQLTITPVVGGISLIQLLNSLVWGGLGGVVGALNALWKHVADEQDFDRQYAMWYITNPVLGIAMGAFVFMVIQAGFFSLTAGVEPNANSIQSAAVVYVFSWIAGFKQNVVYEIVRRILDVFRVNSSSDTNAPLTSPLNSDRG